MQYQFLDNHNDTGTEQPLVDSGTPADVQARGAEARRRILRTSGYFVAIVVCLAFFGLTTPHSVPSVVLIFAFGLLAVAGYCLLKICLVLAGLDSRLSPRLRRGILIVGTLIPVLLLMLQSVGQLTILDLISIIGLGALGSFYASRMGGRSVPRH